MIKSNKEANIITREIFFLYRKAQKLEIAKTILKKLFSKNFPKIFSVFGKSHSAEKTNSGQLSKK